jgi:hypothetical protein
MFFRSIVICLFVLPAVSLGQLELHPVGVFQHGDLLCGAAEIVAFDAQHARLAVVNGQHNALDLVDISLPSAPTLWKRVSLAEYGDIPTSVAVNGSVIAVALCDRDTAEPGNVVLLNLHGERQALCPVGYHPDMVLFTPDGKQLLVANEGEPSDDYALDPEGSISVIDIEAALSGTAGAVTNLDFKRFNHEPLDESVRVFGPAACAAEDFEPEFVAVSPDGKRAMVTLQENNAVAILDVTVPAIKGVVGLGFKDHQQPGHGLDASDVDGKRELQLLPVRGMYQPDAIASFEIAGRTFFVTANEGDVRDYTGFSEVARCCELELEESFAEAAPYQSPDRCGRLQITRTLGDDDGDGRYDAFYAFGTRSFAIWDERAELVYDSGDTLERMSMELFPQEFNSNNDGSSLDARSDDRGPEPEGVAVGMVGVRTYAFLGLERPSAIFVIDVTTPTAPTVDSVYHDSLATVSNESSATRDRGPEGLCFIEAERSPTGKPLLAVAFEVSGTTRIFEIVPRHGISDSSLRSK